MITHSPRVRLLKQASVAAALAATACASLALGDNAIDQQLTAAITEFREETQGEVALNELRIRPLRVVEGGGQEPEVQVGSAHSNEWLTQALNSGLANRLCSEADPCEPSPEVTVLTLSEPYRANEGVFVDARTQSVTDTGFGIVRTTRLTRLRIAEAESGWRVIARTPLWETSGEAEPT